MFFVGVSVDRHRGWRRRVYSVPVLCIGHFRCCVVVVVYRIKLQPPVLPADDVALSHCPFQLVKRPHHDDSLSSLALGHNAFHLVQSAVGAGCSVLDNVTSYFSCPAALAGLRGATLHGSEAWAIVVIAVVTAGWGASFLASYLRRRRSGRGRGR
jgi:hypothetical protein